MRKIILVLLLLFLGVAYFTKPTDKTCTLEGVRAVWGQMLPDPGSKPDYFLQFMNLTAQSVQVKDWIFFKQVKYTLQNETKTVAYGAFKHVYPVVKPIERKFPIPVMPVPQRK